MTDVLATAVPRHKHDLNAARAALELGWPAVEPIALQLLEWLQDLNWPVASVLAPFCASVGAPLAPWIRTVLESTDEVWKYHLVQAVIGHSPELARLLHEDLRRIAEHPTDAEQLEEVHLVARQALEQPL